MKKGDFVLIIIILVVGISSFAAFWFKGEDAKFAVITVNGADYMSLSLNTDTTVRIPESGDSYNIVTIKNGTVQISEADCPDKICVNHSSISRVGETIICLPHKLSIMITGNSDTEETIDGTVY